MIYLISSGNYSDYRVDLVLSGPAKISAKLQATMRERYAAIKQTCSDFWDDPKCDMDNVPEVEAMWKKALIEEFGFKEIENREIHDGQV